jgi:hypothetical protein
METTRGTAEKIRNTVSVSGGGKDANVTTSHITLFQINGKQMKVTSSEPVMIEEGDEVLLAGSERNGVFNAIAYKNITTGARGNTAYLSHLIIGVVFPAAAIFFFTTFAGKIDLDFAPKPLQFLPIIVPAIFFLAGIYILVTGFRIMKARDMLNQ